MIFILWTDFLAVKKIMHWDLKVRLQREISTASRSSSWCLRILMNSWTRFEARSVLLSTKRRTGWLRERRISSSTSSVIEAENSMVCLPRGQFLTISVSASLNPSSSILL